MTNNKVNRFFTTMLGQGKTIPVSTQAVATLISNNDGCIFLMDPTKTFQLNGVNITAPTCGIMANSSLVQTNGGTVSVAGFGYAQSLQNNATSFPKATPQKIPTFADPCAEITGCAYLAANPQPTIELHSRSNSTAAQKRSMAAASVTPLLQSDSSQRWNAHDGCWDLHHHGHLSTERRQRGR